MLRLIHRRDFIQAGAISSAALATHPLDGILTQHLDEQERAAGSESFWQNGARMVISVSMQMEAGAQPLSGAESPIPKIDSKYPDLPTTKWYEYGFKEGLPR